MDESDAENSVAICGPLLVSQLKLILDSDPLIDELGFIHPDQLTGLHAADVSRSGSHGSVSESDQFATIGLPRSEEVSESHSSRSSQDDPKYREVTEQESSDGSGSPPVALQSKEESSLGTDVISLRLDSPKAAWDTVARLPSKREEFQSVSNLPEGTKIEVNCSGDGKRTVGVEDGHAVPLPYDTSAFWCGEHKVAISMLALQPLYLYAQAAFTAIRAEYEQLLRNGRQPESSKCAGASSDPFSEGDLQEADVQANLEDTLQSYSRVLVLVNSDHASAWSIRKRIIQKGESSLKVLTEELQLATLVLSRGPKSEETWAHRRWLINRIVANGIAQPELDTILEGESKLVEAVAGRSAMNYRAWRHRCWLVPQMSALQIAIELHRTKLWARSHIADNCCFHYRRILLAQLTESKVLEGNGASGTEIAAQKRGPRVLKVVRLEGNEIRTLWREEMHWIKKLIQRYKGREALWIHLRFLLSFRIHHVGVGSGSSMSQNQPASSACGKTLANSKDQNFIDTETTFSEICLSNCALDETNDGQNQREYAASYRLWTLALGSRDQCMKESERTTAEHFINVQELLHEVAPHRNQLWDGVIANFQNISM